MGRTQVGEVCGELSPMGGTFMLVQKKSVRRDKEGQRRGMMN